MRHRTTGGLPYAFVVPAYESAQEVGGVVRELKQVAPDALVIVVDDGSQDTTSVEARAAGAQVVRHPVNRGKGAALMTGLEVAYSAGAQMAVSVDADGQHYAHEALKLALDPTPPQALLLGVRDLKRDNAPGNSQFSNGISNFFISKFSGKKLFDTQCGLRRYPLPSTLDLRTRDRGYAFEAEVLLRAARAGIQIAQVPIEVYYPPPSLRYTHFDVVKDPARIIERVVKTLFYIKLKPPKARS